MKLETELRYFGFDLDAMIARAIQLANPKAIKFRRAVFDIPSREGWLRLRTDGVLTTLTVKTTSLENPSESLESEVKVQGFNEALNVLGLLGFHPRSLQTNYRVLFEIQNCEFTIDLWPRIGPIVEIEGANETEILGVAALFHDLGHFRTDKTVSELYEDIGVDVKHVKNLDFDETPPVVVDLITGR